MKSNINIENNDPFGQQITHQNHIRLAVAITIIPQKLACGMQFYINLIAKQLQKYRSQLPSADTFRQLIRKKIIRNELDGFEEHINDLNAQLQEYRHQNG